MCRVVSCPACGSVDSRAPSSFPCVLRLALLRFFSFFATTTITIVTSINHRLRLLLHALFFFFFISSPPSTSLQLKKSQFQRKEILFFFARQPPTCESPNSQNIPFLFSSVPAQHHHYRLNSSPCLHSFNFSGVSITVRSRVCKLKRKYSPWNYRAFPHNS